MSADSDRDTPAVEHSLVAHQGRIVRVLDGVHRETTRQYLKWGVQDHEDGTDDLYGEYRDELIGRNDHRARLGAITWADILEEEVYEAFAETDVDNLRTELEQVAAVCATWIDAIDRRKERVA